MPVLCEGGGRVRRLLEDAPTGAGEGGAGDPAYEELRCDELYRSTAQTLALTPPPPPYTLTLTPYPQPHPYLALKVALTLTRALVRSLPLRTLTRYDELYHGSAVGDAPARAEAAAGFAQRLSGRAEGRGRRIALQAMHAPS